MPYTDPSKRRAWDAAFKKRKYLTDPAYRQRILARVRKYASENRDMVLTKQKAKYQRKKPQYQAAKRWKKYGLTEAAYQTMLHDSGHRCSICRIPAATTRLIVDHCHKTGQVRGILCDKCNRGIGFLDDSIERCKQAIHYLTQSEEV